MSNQDLLVSGYNWSVSFNKETGKLICNFNNEEADDNLSESDGMIGYCTDCKEFFDVRAGCQADIRDDEREKIKKSIDKAAETIVEIIKGVAADVEDTGK